MRIDIQGKWPTPLPCPGLDFAAEYNLELHVCDACGENMWKHRKTQLDQQKRIKKKQQMNVSDGWAARPKHSQAMPM